jgi:hypothetical protein
MKAMRHTARVLLGLLLVACCCSRMRAAERSRFRLWPFGEYQSAGHQVGDAELTGNSLATMPPNATTPNATTPAAALPNAAGTALSQFPSGHDPADTLPERRWMFQSPLAKVSWPRIHMPEAPFPRPRLPRPQLWPKKAEVDDARNAWMQKIPDPTRPSPLQAVQQGAQRVGQSTRSAWRRTVDVLTPGDASSTPEPRVASSPDQPPLWKRMIGTSQPQQQGPQTVSEWMAQERLNP